LSTGTVLQYTVLEEDEEEEKKKRMMMMNITTGEVYLDPEINRT
jgi:hypothetical protein